MKSQRRHELQTNALASELVQMKDFFAKYGNWVLMAVVVVVFILLTIFWLNRRAADRAANEWNTYTRIVNDRTMLDKERDPQLVDLINSAKSPAIAAGAATFLAESLTERYTLALTDPQGQRVAGDIKAMATQYYQLVIDRYSDLKSFVARAYLGLGKLAEDDGEFTKAQQDYQQVLSVVNGAYPVAIEAQRRLQHIDVGGATTGSAPSSQPAAVVVDNWATPVRFSTTAPASEPASAPASLLPPGR